MDQTVKKTVRLKENSAVKEANKSSCIKKSFVKTPGAKKAHQQSKLAHSATKEAINQSKINKTINKTISKANLSQLKSSLYDDMNRDQVRYFFE